MPRRAKILISPRDIVRAYGYDLDQVAVTLTYIDETHDLIGVVMEGEQFPDIPDDAPATVVSVHYPATATDEQLTETARAHGLHPDGSVPR